jgi:hypothetical protein
MHVDTSDIAAIQAIRFQSGGRCSLIRPLVSPEAPWSDLCKVVFTARIATRTASELDSGTSGPCCLLSKCQRPSLSVMHNRGCCILRMASKASGTYHIGLEDLLDPLCTVRHCMQAPFANAVANAVRAHVCANAACVLLATDACPTSFSWNKVVRIQLRAGIAEAGHGARMQRQLVRRTVHRDWRRGKWQQRHVGLLPALQQGPRHPQVAPLL